MPMLEVKDYSILFPHSLQGTRELSRKGAGPESHAAVCCDCNNSASVWVSKQLPAHGPSSTLDPRRKIEGKSSKAWN